MSIREDLEAFQDLALSLQYDINALPDCVELDPDEVYGQLDPLLASIIGAEAIVLVTGEVHTPVVDEESKQVTGQKIEKLVSGVSKGVYVSREQHSIGDELDLARYMIGYWVRLPDELVKRSHVEVSRTTLLAFAPIETCRLHVPDQEVDELVGPPINEGDEIGAAIEEVALEESLDLNKLWQIFDRMAPDSDQAEPKTSLEIDVYVEYLNSLISLDKFDVTGKAKRLISEQQLGIITEHIQRGIIAGFANMNGAISFHYLHTIESLCLKLEGIMVGIPAYVPITEIAEFSMERSVDSVAE